MRDETLRLFAADTVADSKLVDAAVFRTLNELRAQMERVSFEKGSECESSGCDVVRMTER